MTRKSISTVAIALSALLAGQAFAANTNASPVTRAQVQAELAEAVRNGQIFDNAQDTMLNRAYPQRYTNANAQAQAGKTRAQVQAELAQAAQRGQVFDTATDQYVNVAYPANYPASQAAGKTRAQVQAELAEAVRTGQIFDTASDTTLRNAYPGRY